jgi:protein TonB
LPQRSVQPKPSTASNDEAPAPPRRRVTRPKAAPAADAEPKAAPAPGAESKAAPAAGAESKAAQPKPAAPRKAPAKPARAKAPAIRPVVTEAPAPANAAAPARPRTAPRKTAHLAPAGALPPARIPPEALRAPRHDRLLGAAIIVSMVIHAIVLAIHFSPFDLRQLADKGPPLEIALVNAKSKSKPTKADILAQANLDGGGNTDENRRAKTPLPVLPKESAQNDVALASQKVEALEQQTRELLTQLRSQAVPAPHPKATDTPDTTDSPTANEIMQRTVEAVRLEAQIAKDMDAYQKRPKRRFVGARAHEYRFARYVEDWRLKVERVGNLNYPEAARANKLYGSLLLTVSIRSDGSVEHVEVNKSSGKRILDAAAVKIVQMAGPYAPFPPDIKRDTDILHITRTWTFAKGDELRGE